MFDSRSPSRDLLSTVLVAFGLILLLAGGALMSPDLIPHASTVVTLPPPLPSEPSVAPQATPSPSATPVPPALLPSFKSDEDRPAGDPSSDAPDLLPTPTPAPEGFPPTRIVIPSIGLDAPVVTTTWEVVNVGGVQQAIWKVPPMRAAGWHQGSAPLGVPGNTVLNGHNTTHGEVFRDLYRVQPGDLIFLYSDDRIFTYAVDEVLILPEAGQPLEVRQANARYIQPTEDERVTLVTCHPYGSLRYRLIVIARPVEALPQGAK
ncbi:MAG TPA: sortase [Chloroflexi bacterium]|nr:sortase [Chloroflexota bacterium]